MPESAVGDNAGRALSDADGSIHIQDIIDATTTNRSSAVAFSEGSPETIKISPPNHRRRKESGSSEDSSHGSSSQSVRSYSLESSRGSDNRRRHERSRKKSTSRRQKRGRFSSSSCTKSSSSTWSSSLQLFEPSTSRQKQSRSKDPSTSDPQNQSTSPMHKHKRRMKADTEKERAVGTSAYNGNCKKKKIVMCCQHQKVVPIHRRRERSHSRSVVSCSNGSDCSTISVGSESSKKSFIDVSVRSRKSASDKCKVKRVKVSLSDRRHKEDEVIYLDIKRKSAQNEPRRKKKHSKVLWIRLKI